MAHAQPEVGVRVPQERRRAVVLVPEILTDISRQFDNNMNFEMATVVQNF